MGKGNYQGGIFNLFVSFDYDAKRFFTAWKDGFNRASRLLLQATGGKMRFGTITVANKKAPFTHGVDRKKEADIVIYGPSYTGPRLSCLADSCNGIPPTWPYQNPCLGWGYKYFTLLHDDHLQPWIIIHEFSHYALGLYDESKNQFSLPGGSCCHLLNNSKCIMEVCSSTVNQYCDLEHTPNNMQEAKNKKSCWGTIREKYPDISLHPVLPDPTITWVVI